MKLLFQNNHYNLTHSNDNSNTISPKKISTLNDLWAPWERREETQLLSEFRKHWEKITMDIIVIYQADQEIAALDLQKPKKYIIAAQFWTKSWSMLFDSGGGAGGNMFLSKDKWIRTLIRANLFKQFSWWVTLWVQASPSPWPDLKCLILPHHEASRIHNSWLDDLLRWEDSPCYSIHISLANVRYPTPSFIYSHVGQRWESLALVNKRIQLLPRAEKLYIGLLINIPSRTTPSWTIHNHAKNKYLTSNEVCMDLNIIWRKGRQTV